MKIIFLNSAEITTLTKHPQDLPASILTIGNFDGIHLGHQAMLNQLKETAKQQELASMVMIFEPQPREYFAQLKGDPQLAPARLTSQDEKLALLKAFAIDIVVVATFDTSFRSLSASQFADMLINALNVKRLVLGDDFRFGNDRTGDSEFLRHYGLPVTNLHTITDTYVTDIVTDTDKTDIQVTDNHTTDTHSTAIKDRNVDANSYLNDSNEPRDDRISSTRIRELLSLGHLKTANRLLGRDYSIIGKVIEGDQIGRTLDFPTANIALNRLLPALHGVYGVDVVALDDTGNTIANAFQSLATDNNFGIAGFRPHSLFGAANIGLRPSIEKPHDWRLEVFFPEFSGNLYGQTLAVRFLHHLHDERKYEGLAALKAGIQQDVTDLIAWRRNILQPI